MTKIKDLKIYLVSEYKDLCFYWEKYFGERATVVNNTLENFYSGKRECEGFTFYGPAYYVKVYDGDVSLPQDYFIHRSLVPVYDKKTYNKLNDIIRTNYHGLMSVSDCIYTEVSGRKTWDRRQVYAFYTPDQLERRDYSDTTSDIVFQCMYNTLFKACEAGVESIALPDWGKDCKEPEEDLASKVIAGTMLRAYEAALRYDEAIELTDPLYPKPPLWLRTDSTDKVGMCWYENIELLDSENKFDFDNLYKSLEKELIQKKEYINSHMRILNLHELQGEGKNTAYGELAKMFPDKCIDAPCIEYETMWSSQIFKKYMSKQYDLIVGTGFGGFFAFVLGAMQGVPTVLINPCVPPDKYIKKYVDGYGDTVYLNYVWDMLKKDSELWTYNFAGKILNYTPYCIVILGTEDEIMDAKMTEEILPAWREEVAV